MSDAPATPLQRRATLLLLTTTVLWGATFFSVQIGCVSLAALAPPESFRETALLYGLFRWGVAAAAFVLLFPRALGRLRKLAWLDGLKIGFPCFCGILLQMWALQGEASSMVAFLSNLTVVFTPLLGIFFFRERLTRPVVAGVAVAVAGIFLLLGVSGSGSLKAQACAVASSAFFALQIQQIGPCTRRSDPEAVTLTMFVWMGLLSLGILLLLPQGRALLNPDLLSRAFRDRDVVWTILFNAVGVSVVAGRIVNVYQREISATRAVVIYALEPFFATLLALAFTGEQMTGRMMAGGALIFAGNLVCEWRGKRGVRSALAARPGEREAADATGSGRLPERDE